MSVLLTRPKLFKSWIALSTGLITIQCISIRETNCAIHWIGIYLVDSAIHLLNNWDQGMKNLMAHQVQGKQNLAETWPSKPINYS